MHVGKSTLVVAALLAAATGSADAAPKPTPKPAKPLCNLITDGGSDAIGSPAVGFQFPNDPSMDIVSADIATDGKHVTAVLRLAALEQNDPYSPVGREYAFGFSTARANYEMQVTMLPTGNSFGDGKGVIDIAKKEIRLTQALASFSPPLKLAPGAKLIKLTAGTRRIVGPAGTPADRKHLVDTAATNTAYPHMHPSCVKVNS